MGVRYVDCVIMWVMLWWCDVVSGWCECGVVVLYDLWHVEKKVCCRVFGVNFQW